MHSHAGMWKKDGEEMPQIMRRIGELEDRTAVNTGCGRRLGKVEHVVKDWGLRGENTVVDAKSDLAG